MSLRHELRFAHLRSGARLAWAASGRGPALVRAAHWMTHLEHDLRSPIWRPWLERLGREVRLIRYDERGCGLSGADAVPLDIESAVEELEVVIDAAAHERAYPSERVALLGISGGAAPSIVYAARHPARVSHLVLLGGYACGVRSGHSSAEAVAYVEATARLIELGWGRAGSPVQQFFTATLIPQATAEQLRALNEQQLLSCDAARAAAIFRARTGLDVREWLPRVTCPTLVLHAKHDAAVAAESGRRIAASIPGARFETLDSHNHIPLAGEPAFERFCEVVTEFLRPPQTDGDRAFTARERDLLALVAQGLDNAQIAARLALAEKSVRNATSRLYARLGVSGRPQAVVRARELGFG